MSRCLVRRLILNRPVKVVTPCRPWAVAGVSLIGFAATGQPWLHLKNPAKSFRTYSTQQQVLEDTAVVRVVPKPVQQDEFNTVSEALTHLLAEES